MKDYHHYKETMANKGEKKKGHVYQTSACNVSQSRKNQTAEQSRRDSESAKEVISNQTVSSNYLIYFFTFKELF